MGLRLGEDERRPANRRGPHKWVDTDQTYWELNMLLGLVVLAVLVTVLIVVVTAGG